MKPNFLTINPDEKHGCAEGPRLAGPRSHPEAPARPRTAQRQRDQPRARCRNRRSRPTSRCSKSSELIRTETVKAKKGQQKICSARFDEIIVRFEVRGAEARQRTSSRSRCRSASITNCDVSAALRPLLERGRHRPARRARLLSRSRAACRRRWSGSAAATSSTSSRTMPSSSTRGRFGRVLHGAFLGGAGHQPQLAVRHHVWVNDVAVGTWTSPGDYRRQARRLHAALVEARRLAIRQAEDLADQQGRHLRRRRAHLRRDASTSSTCRGTTRSACASASTRKAEHPGGVNIFGKGFGNYDQDIIMRLHLRRNGAGR